MAEDPAAARTSLGPVILFLQDIDRFGSYEREMRPAVVVQVHNDLRLSALLSGVICCMPFFAEAACRPCSECSSPARVQEKKDRLLREAPEPEGTR